MIAILARTSEHHAMGMKRRGRNGRRAGTMQETRIRLQRIQERAINIKQINIMPFRACSKNGCMLMHGQCTQRVLCCAHGAKRLVLADIPELDLAVAAAGDEFAEAAALHVDVCDPLLVVAPAFDHGLLGAEALVEDTDGAVAVAAHEHVARDLVRGEGCDAGARASGNVLGNISRVFTFGEQGKAYIGAYLSSRIPDSNDFDITGD